MMFAHSSTTAIGLSNSQITDRIKLSPQYQNGKFNGDIEALTMTIKDGIFSTWQFLFKKNNQTPKGPLPTQHVELSYFNTTRKDLLNSTWLGHSSLMININGYKILTDPVFTKKVSIVGPARFNGELPLNPKDLTDIDVVIISHDHYDHLNKYSIKLLTPITQRFIVPLAVGKRLAAWGVPENKIIGKKFGPFDMTFIECGAYNELWRPVHMFPEETVQAHMDLKGKLLHPIHWGTFNLALHPWYEPMQRLTKAAQSSHIPVATPISGQSIQCGTDDIGSSWWETTLNNQKITQTNRRPTHDTR